MATFKTYAEALRPDHPLMKIHKAALMWRPSRYRSADIERGMRAEPGVALGDVLQRTGGVYETTTRMTPKFREDIREIAELTSDDRLLMIAELAEVPVSLKHLRHVDPQTRMLIGYRLDVTPAESPRLRRRLALPPDPAITLHFDEVPFPDTPGRFWGSMRWDRSMPASVGALPSRVVCGISAALASGTASHGHPPARAQAFLRARISAVLFSLAIYGISSA